MASTRRQSSGLGLTRRATSSARVGLVRYYSRILTNLCGEKRTMESTTLRSYLRYSGRMLRRHFCKSYRSIAFTNSTTNNIGFRYTAKTSGVLRRNYLQRILLTNFDGGTSATTVPNYSAGAFLPLATSVLCCLQRHRSHLRRTRPFWKRQELDPCPHVNEHA